MADSVGHAWRALDPVERDRVSEQMARIMGVGSERDEQVEDALAPSDLEVRSAVAILRSVYGEQVSSTESVAHSVLRAAAAARDARQGESTDDGQAIREFYAKHYDPKAGWRIERLDLAVFIPAIGDMDVLSIVRESLEDVLDIRVLPLRGPIRGGGSRG